MKGGVKSKKNLIKLMVFGVMAVAGVIGLGLAARSYEGISQSEETNEVFNAAAQLPPELLEAVIWQRDPENLTREMEPLTRVDLTSAWIRAWEQLSIVAQTGSVAGLEIYFSNSALEGLLASAQEVRGRPVNQLSHNLRVDFYSEDGQVIGLTADQVGLVRSVPIGGTLGWVQSVESYEAVLVLEDGNWRVQHWVRRSTDERWWTEPVDPATEFDAATFAVNGINYFPQDHPFDAFWANYDPDVVDADLERIAGLGADSVRVFLPFDELGGRWTTEEQLEPVIDFLDRAEAHELEVVATLFDGRTDHRTDKWDSDRAHAETVVQALRDHPALMMWDLKNEPDRDIGANGVSEQLMYAWLGHVAHVVRGEDPATPLTVGWSTPEAALAAPIHTDVVSYHYYAPTSEFEELAIRVQEHAAGRPVLVSEFGLPTWNSYFPGGHTEVEQARYIADVRSSAERLGLRGTMAWTLWDLAESPPDAGRFPWNTGPQKALGLLRADGTEKPAAALIDSAADLDAVPAPGLFNRLGKSFWRLMIVAGIGLVGLRILGRKVRSRKQRDNPFAALLATMRKPPPDPEVD